MDDIAVYCSWANAELQKDSEFTAQLPPTIQSSLFETTGSTYLATLSEVIRTPDFTDKTSILYRPILAEVSARWLNPPTFDRLGDDILTLSCLARILPFAAHLRPRITHLVSHDSLDSLLRNGYGVRNLDEDQLHSLLLALFRLLSYDRAAFDHIANPVLFSTLLSHSSTRVKYLAVQCLCFVMHFSDPFSESLVETYVGTNAMIGDWEGLEVDYRLLRLFEEKRWSSIGAEIKATEQKYQAQVASLSAMYTSSDLSSQTSNIGGVLIPRNENEQTLSTFFVPTTNAQKNLKTLGRALLDDKSILLSGPAGSGKTSLILEAARNLNKQSSLITLHLNEQTDAKSLIGIYTSSQTGDSFTWEPGVITKAVQQGRWILIEDIDRVPNDVLGVLRPIIENGELFLASRKERIRPKEGFRVLATMRTASGMRRPSSSRHALLSNSRIWNTVEILEYDTDEIGEIMQARFPNAKPLMKTILQCHQSVCDVFQENSEFKAAQSRLPSIRDLLKWCRRIDTRTKSSSYDTKFQTMPESMQLEIFKDCVDCYAGYLNDERLYLGVASCIAQQMSISPQQMQHCLSTTTDHIVDTGSSIRIGRTVLPKLSNRKHHSRVNTFAMTQHAKRTLENISAGVGFAEPYLLVGETGVGKTTIVQYVASLIGQKLTVINLSQQSEATDLLGGLKPITTKSLILPMIEQFNGLFDDTFSAKRNEKFQVALSKAVDKQNWSRLLLLWQEAVQMANDSLKTPSESTSLKSSTHANKRRKLLTPKYEALRGQWKTFSNTLDMIRAQNERGDKNHTFAFVEGRLVQAVRNGEWLLLDEINLASSDTLDHIFSLLHNGDEERPSILLTESGDVQRVMAHPNFRIFAAMNPATDAGKKDLAPGLRSRFTELYVQPGDKDVNDLVEIIKTYLGELLVNDRRAAMDLAKAYLEVNRLNSEHRLSDGAGELPHFSIRSLVRCLLYVSQHGARHGLRRAMYEGFAMSFFTVLSRDSENVVTPILKACLLSNLKNINSFLAQQPKIPFDEDKFIAFRHHLVVKGPMFPDLQPHYIRTPSVERSLVNLARAVSMRRFPILIQGPTSAGKTSMIEYLAKLSGNKFVRINNHEHTDLQEYLGSYASGVDGRLEYREGVLVEALRQGHWIVLDELNLAPSDVLEALNRLLDDNRELLIPESQEIVRPHPNFMLFATQNPAGLYGGRKRLSRAFRNRFLELHFDDIPEEELEIILRQRAQIAPSYCTQIVAVYKKLSLQRQSNRLFEQRNSFATLRDLFRWASRPLNSRQQLAYHGFMLLAERVRDPSERQVVKNIIEETMRVVIDEDVLYASQVLPNSAIECEGIVWTSAMRRLFVLVSEALKNNEPVLLVGETGCGKTQICQVIARVFGKQLNIYNAHTNTETGDLIGSQRPVRSRAELAHHVLDNLRSLGAPLDDDILPEDFDVDELIAKFHQMDTTSLDQALVAQTKSSIQAYQSLFAWTDGSLVRAMKAGEHFLLDEISLADDSVLERLNSVLELSRTILLAEKGSSDNLVVADPGFQFLSTMNPGGDYGKRELSAALRNRLTVIWVPPLSQESDVLPILQAKLSSDNLIIAPVMLNFTLWFRKAFQNSASNVIPLRDLLAWAQFINGSKHLPSEVAMIHGAAMVFIDSIGANPAGLTSTAATDIAKSRRACLEYLQGLVHCDVFAIYEQTPILQIARNHLSVGPFLMIRADIAPESVPNMVFDAPTTLKNTMRIVRALQMARPILLEGSPGVGKTAIVTALAHALGKHLTRINLSDQTDLMDLFGADAPSDSNTLGRFTWRDGPLLQAMQSGGWVLLDEMNLASQSVLEGLNSCLDHRKEVYIAELDKSFICHPNFTLFAAQNPHHQGGGRKGLPASFINRFTVVYADSFQPDDLLCICQNTYPTMSESSLGMVVQSVSTLEQFITSSSSFGDGGPWELNLRDVNRWLTLCAKYPTLSPDYHFNTIVAQKFRNSVQWRNILEVQSKLKSLPSESFYQYFTSEQLQVGISKLDRDNVFQPLAAAPNLFPVAQLRYAKSAITAITQNWPLLLVGHSGTGKTRLIRYLAAASGAKLLELSMNSDTDTMDLLGGFEQYDVRRDVVEIQAAVCKELLNLIVQTLALPKEDKKLEYLLSVYQTFRTSDIEIKMFEAALQAASDRLSELHPYRVKLQSIINIQQDLKSRFVWNDGVLLDALQEGVWLVLDNANLCNPSVLDRLNSLLEPNGHLTVSEQHNTDQGARIIKPHPNFRIFLTMDPRYGELSRAMRNRSLEMYMEAKERPQDAKFTLTYPMSSSISRIRDLDSFASTALDVEAYKDQMSLSDLQGLQTIVQTSVSTLPVLRKSIASRLFSNPWESFLWRDLSYDMIADPWLQTLSEAEQPTFIVLNEPRLLLSNGQPALQIATHITSVRYFYSDLSYISTSLDKASKQINQVQYNEMTILEKSIAVNQISKARQQTVPRIAQFIRLIYEQLKSLINAATVDGHLDSARRVLFLAKDLVNLFNVKTIDIGRFQAYLRVISEELSVFCKDEPSYSKSLVSSFSLLKDNFELTTGRGLQRMWLACKPVTATTATQLSAQLTLEQLISTFDNLTGSLLLSKVELAKIRSKLRGALEDIWRFDEPANALQVLQTAVEGLEKQPRRIRQSTGHFAGLFDILLRRILFIQANSKSEKDLDLLSILSSESVFSLEHSSQQNPTAEAMQQLALISNRSINDLNSFGLQSLRLLANIQNQSLGGFKCAKEELNHFVYACSEHTFELDSGLILQTRRYSKVLLSTLMLAHENFLVQKGVVLVNKEDGLDLTDSSLMEIRKIIHNVPEDQKYFFEIYSQHLYPALLSISESSTIQNQSAGFELLHISMAILKCMVPDKPFDPALMPAVVNERHAFREAEIRQRIEVQKRLHEHIAGKADSMLIRILEHDLIDLGEATPIPPVVRPFVSELSILQEDFSSILRILSSVDLLLSLGVNDKFDEIQRLIEYVDKIADRLRKANRAYDDFVKPITWLIQSLKLALCLWTDNETIRGGVVAEVALRTPLLSISPEAIISQKPRKASRNRILDFQKLEHISVSYDIAPPIGRTSNSHDIEVILDVMDRFYYEWKAHLARDQVEAEAQSKYYAYRGDAAVDEEADSREMAELFPTYNEEDEENVDSARKAGYDPRTTAVMLANLNENLFGTEHATLNLREYIDKSINKITTLQNQSGESGQTISTEDLLPGMFLRLEQESKELECESAKASNIYVDANLKEYDRLVELTEKIQNRFREIQERWPEHAVPSEVLSFTDELLAFRMIDPLAKVLTKAEKLLEIISQWQSVASREWTAASLMDELIALIIDWRRLELSSWSRLLDQEQQKYEDDARSWFFIAYEAVIHNTRHLVDENGDVPSYCQGLTITIEQFLRNATLGQFSSRLRLLKSLHKILVEASAKDIKLNPLAACAINVLHHYGRYESQIQKSLETGRAQLEKSLTEQIKLASWKDTNITALRDSAKRSHHKLFKIVRKYRALLGQSISEFRALESTLAPTEVSTTHLAPPNVQNALGLEKAIAQCKIELQGWSERPERLRSPLETASNMRKIYTRRPQLFAAGTELNMFVDNLGSTIKELRTETPSTFNDETSGLVRQLATQKRRLLADTMKTIAQMGIRRNLSTVELGKQSSVASILAALPELEMSESLSSISVVETNFHEVVDTMPQVRLALTNHSDDLTEGEVRRANGLLEGLLYMIIRQRTELAPVLEKFQALEVIVKPLHVLADVAASDEFFDLPSNVASHISRMYRIMSWLPHMLELSYQVLQFQSLNAKLDIEELLEMLQKCKEHLQSIGPQIKKISEFPGGVVSQSAARAIKEASEVIQNLGFALKEWQIKEPRIEFMLRQIIPWTKDEQIDTDQSINGAHDHDLSDVETDIRTTCDSVFVALQQVHGIQENINLTTEDQGWLTKNDKHFTELTRALHIGQISEKVGTMLSLLQHTASEQLSTAIALLISSLPIIEQYSLICKHVVEKQMAIHLETCRMAVFLSKTFVTLSSQGFCGPSEPSNGQEQSGKLESGTGLGEGEGAEDISKDIGEDEDLSDLAQNAEAEKHDGVIENSKDAIDMGADELEGEEVDHENEKSDDEDDKDMSGSEGENEMDEETGSVDDLDPSAVDEKMWDDLKNEAENDKELQNDEAKGSKSDEQTAADNKQQRTDKDVRDNLEDEMNEETEDEEQSENGNEGDAVPEAENIDQHAQEEKTLDLPEELQLNGDEDMKDGDISDDGMDDLSDIDEPQDPAIAPEEGDELGDDEKEESKPTDGEVDKDEEGEAEELESDEPTALGDEIKDDQDEEANEEKDKETQEDNAQFDIDKNDGGETGTANQFQQDIQDQQAAGMNETEETELADETKGEGQPDNQQQGDKGQGRIERGVGREPTIETPQNEALKKLADVLDQWHQRREIFNPSEQQRQEESGQDIEMADADFEHVAEEDQGETQAIGAAGAEQAQQLDQSKAIEDEDMQIDEDHAPIDISEQEMQQENMTERFNRFRMQAQDAEKRDNGAFVPNQRQKQTSADQYKDTDALADDVASEIEHLDFDQHQVQSPPTSMADAAQLWTQCSTATHQFSLILTEQLRLILAPTTATKLRGDFRSGKRLNIKRIIPYIASGYKRDKIWLRRSVPSKRNYQIMLAVDDSRSMRESGADILAFETLSLLCKSLSMLESGELCVVSFGDSDASQQGIRIAHPFGQPFSGDTSGTALFRHFTFNQTATDVRRLVHESITIFQDARLKRSSAGSAESDLWQLQLIISDGHCNDHPAISRLVRQAQAEKIMIVFVIVDAAGSTNESILDLKEALFEPDPDNEGEMRVRTKRYLEGFPFPYYLVVRDVRDLPGVLATALKGWFGSVVDVQV